MDPPVKLSTNRPPPSSPFKHSHESSQHDDSKREIRMEKLSTTPTATTKLLLKTEQQA
jgi:hypothetical protein